jgi:hypothetical protein
MMSNPTDEDVVTVKKPQAKRRLVVKGGFVAIFAIAYVRLLCLEVKSPMWHRYLSMLDDLIPTPEELHAVTRKHNTPKIAIISSFVPSSQYQGNSTQVKDLDHLINKACYSYIWGYDFIFNMTFGFDRQKDIVEGGKYWLDYGTWVSQFLKS